MRAGRETGLCTHGLTDDVIVTDTTEVVDYRFDTVRKTVGFYCPEHRQYGYLHLNYDLERDLWRSTSGLPGRSTK
jgi:hypothetical protein